MSQQIILEIKTFSISNKNKKEALTFENIGTTLFGADSDELDNEHLVGYLKYFLAQSIDSLKGEDGFLINPTKTKKFKFHVVESDFVNSCVYGVVAGGNIGDEGNFNKKNGKLYSTTPLGLEDFTDTPFMFLIYFPINSDTGVIMCQKYSDRTLNNEIRQVFRQGFYERGYTMRYNPFLSEKQKKLFKKAMVEKVTITQNKAGKKLNDKFSFLGDDKQYKIKIEISEIDTPIQKFADRIRVKGEKDIEEYIDYFPELNEFGIEKDKASVETFIKNDGGTAKPKMKDLGNYLDKILPKITIDTIHKIRNESGKYIYDDMLKQMVSILNKEVIPTLNKKK